MFDIDKEMVSQMATCSRPREGREEVLVSFMTPTSSELEHHEHPRLSCVISMNTA